MGEGAVASAAFVTSNVSGGVSVGLRQGLTLPANSNLVIPDRIAIVGNVNQQEVRAVSASGFSGQSTLSQVSIPSTVTSIGTNAFRDATSLHTINFANNSQLQTIGMDAFRNATSLTNLTIPASVTSIGNGAFQDVTNLQTVTFAANSQLRTIGNSAFGGMILGLTQVTIPASVTTLGDSAFN